METMDKHGTLDQAEEYLAFGKHFSINNYIVFLTPVNHTAYTSHHFVNNHYQNSNITMKFKYHCPVSVIQFFQMVYFRMLMYHKSTIQIASNQV